MDEKPNEKDQVPAIFITDTLNACSQIEEIKQILGDINWRLSRIEHLAIGGIINYTPENNCLVLIAREFRDILGDCNYIRNSIFEDGNWEEFW